MDSGNDKTQELVIEMETKMKPWPVKNLVAEADIFAQDNLRRNFLDKNKFICFPFFIWANIQRSKSSAYISKKQLIFPDIII